MKKDNCWSEQSPENRLFLFFGATRYKNIIIISLGKFLGVNSSPIDMCYFLRYNFFYFCKQINDQECSSAVQEVERVLEDKKKQVCELFIYRWKRLKTSILLGAQQNNVKHCVCHMRRIAGNASFCQVHAFEVLAPPQLIAKFHIIVCYICWNFIPSKILSSNIISCHFIYNANGIFKLLEF